jgi:hypothetical protein
MATLAVIAFILLAWLENWTYWHQLLAPRTEGPRRPGRSRRPARAGPRGAGWHVRSTAGWDAVGGAVEVTGARRLWRSEK